MDQMLHILLLAIPLIFGGIIHMVAVKRNVLSYLNKPIHQRWFGRNKTWRGFVIMPLATLPGVWCSQWIEKLMDVNTQVFRVHSSIYLALGLGLAYCLAEMPNSFVKRRLGVVEGQISEKYKWFFIIMDQADSAIGCILFYVMIASISLSLAISTVIFGTVLHLMLNILLFKAKIRKNPF